MSEKYSHSDEFERINQNEELGNSGPTDFQVQAENQTERVNEAREAAEMIKLCLAGLKYKPASLEEAEKLLVEGRTKQIDDDKEVAERLRSWHIENESPEPPKEAETLISSYLFGVSAEKISASTGISIERVNELVARNHSTSFLLSHFYGFSEATILLRKELKDARYFTIAELAQRADEHVDLFLRAKMEIQNPDVEYPAIQRLSDEYCWADKKIFDIDEITGKVNVKKNKEKDKEKIQEEIDKKIEAATRYGDQIRDVLKSGRTGIDPGVLLASEDRKKVSFKVGGYGGYYRPGGQLGGDLGKTGLIVVPAYLQPAILKHEYAHFEDWIFGRKEGFALDNLITEINSFFISEIKDVSKNDLSHFFDYVKKTILDSYLKEYKVAPMDFDGAKEKVVRSIDIIERLYKNGFSSDVISSILLQADKFEDILQWENVKDSEISELIKVDEEEILMAA